MKKTMKVLFVLVFVITGQPGETVAAPLVPVDNCECKCDLPLPDPVKPLRLTVAKRSYKAFVDYDQPSYNELLSLFRGRVEDRYKETTKFETIKKYKDVNRNSRQVTFYYVRIDRRAPTAEIITAMDQLGFRPAIYEELLAFAKQFPDERKNYVVALGSVCEHPDGMEYVADMSEWYSSDNATTLSMNWSGTVREREGGKMQWRQAIWEGDEVFLAVKK